MAIRIVTDSNCDLPPDILDRHGITVVPFYINIGTKSYLDVQEMSHAEFYEGLPHFDAHPQTSVPGPGAYVEVYERLAAEGATEILSIHMGSSLSAMGNSARLAAEEVQSVPVTIFDSGNLTLGTGLQVVAAARAAAAGRSVDEIVALLADMVPRTHCFAVLDTLEYLRRSGRLTHFQWSLGSLLRVKPILKMSADRVEMERVGTRGKAIERLLDLTAALGPLEALVPVHTHAAARAAELEQIARPLFPPPSVLTDGIPSAEVTPVIGAHIGPGAVGFIAIQARSTQVPRAEKEES